VFHYLLILSGSVIAYLARGLQPLPSSYYARNRALVPVLGVSGTPILLGT